MSTCDGAIADEPPLCTWLKNLRAASVIEPSLDAPPLNASLDVPWRCPSEASAGDAVSKNARSGSVAIKFCSTELRKQVLPRFLSPRIGCLAMAAERLLPLLPPLPPLLAKATPMAAAEAGEARAGGGGVLWAASAIEAQVFGPG